MHLTIHLLLLASLIFILSNAQDSYYDEKQVINEPDIKIITGAYINTINKAIVYEGSSILTFQLPKLPDLLRNNYSAQVCNVNYNSTHPHCNLYKHNKYLFHEIANMLRISHDLIYSKSGSETIFKPYSHDPQEDSEFVKHSTAYSIWHNIPGNRDKREITKDRSKRGFSLFPFISKPFKYCCGFSTEDDIEELHVSQKHIELYYKQLADSVNSNHRDILQQAEKNSNFQRYTSETFENILGRINLINYGLRKTDNDMHNEIDLVHNLISELGYLTWYEHVMQIHLIAKTSCLNKKLPLVFVSETALTEELLKFNHTLQKHSKEIAIPIESLAKYYTLPITSCQYTDQDIVINVRVPIKSLGSEWQLYEIRPIPLSHEQKTCHLKTTANFVAKDKDRVIPLSIIGNHKCQPFDTGLCYIEAYESTLINGDFCLTKIIEGARTLDFRICNYNCEDNNKTHIRPISQHVFSVTNPPSDSTIHCLEKDVSVFSNLTDLGAIIVHLPCDCELRIPGHRAIKPIFPCLMNDPDLTQYHIIPARWAKLHTYIPPTNLPEHNPSYLKIEDCYDPHWMFRDTNDSTFESLYVPPPTFHDHIWQNVHDTNPFVSLLLFILLGFTIYLLIRERQLSKTLAFFTTLTLPQPANLQSQNSKVRHLLNRQAPNYTCNIPTYIEVMINLMFLLLIVKYLRKLISYLWTTLWLRRQLNNERNMNLPSYRSNSPSNLDGIHSGLNIPSTLPGTIPQISQDDIPKRTRVHHRYKDASKLANHPATSTRLEPPPVYYPNPSESVVIDPRSNLLTGSVNYNNIR